MKLEANVGKFWIRLQASVPRLRDPTGAYRYSYDMLRSDPSTSRLRVGIHHDWRLRLQTTTYVRPKSATRAEVYQMQPDRMHRVPDLHCIF